MNRQKAPTISVIMPVFNAQRYVAQAIESILAQTCQDFELIIIDDASTDGSWDIVCRYSAKYPEKIRAKKLARNVNQGGDACANIAFRMAKGAFIARMDADDIAHPTRLQKQLSYLRHHPEVILLGTQADVIDGNGQVTGEKMEPTEHDRIYQEYCIHHPIIHPSMMLRRSLLPRRHYLYRTEYSANNDLLTFFELLQYGKFANLPEKLISYRIHGKNDHLTNPKEKFFNTLKIRMTACRRFGYVPTKKAIVLTIMQLVVVLCVPSICITPLYMLWRGVAKRGVSQLRRLPTLRYLSL